MTKKTMLEVTGQNLFELRGYAQDLLNSVSRIVADPALNQKITGKSAQKLAHTTGGFTEQVRELNFKLLDFLLKNDGKEKT